MMFNEEFHPFLSKEGNGWSFLKVLRMKKAFTLIEIIIVIVIVGIMAALAIPKLTGQKEQAIVSEAIVAVQAFHGAQLRYELEHPGTYAAACATLDVTATLKNFTVACANDGSVTATRINGASAYTVSESIAGVFTCPSDLHCPH